MTMDWLIGGIWTYDDSARVHPDIVKQAKGR